MRRRRYGAAFLFVGLFVFWVVVAMGFDTIQMLVGVLAAALIVLYSLDMVFTKDDVGTLRFKLIFSWVKIVFVMLYLIVSANIAVARIVLSPKMKMSPQFKRIPQPLKKTVNQALYGNAITLTPGTLTVSLNDEEIIVHALTKETAEGIEDGLQAKLFKQLEEDEQ